MIKEELTKLLMEAYERGQSDLIKSCQETVSIAIDTAILAEREACIVDIQWHIPRSGRHTPEYQMAMRMLERIRARGQA